MQTPLENAGSIFPSRSQGAHLYFVVLLLWVLPGCSWEWAHRIYPLPFYETSVTVGGDPARMRALEGRIAVLPFTFAQESGAEREEAVKTLRESFGTAIERLRSYETIPSEEVDARLAEAGIARMDLDGIDLQTIARITGADAVLYGNITRTRNLTLYVYSHTVYEGTFALMEAGTGDLLWYGHLWEGLRGGLFIDLFVVDMFIEEPKNKDLPEAYRRVSNAMVKKLIETIPERAAPIALSGEAP